MRPGGQSPPGKKKELKRKGKVNVKPEVIFTPSGGGDTSTEKAKIKLVKR